MQAWLGSHDSQRWNLRADGAAGNWRGRAGLGRFQTDGHRPHSAARRDEAHALAQWTPAPGQQLQFGFDALHQPDTDDPLGLSPAQWRSNPHATDGNALAFDTRKRIDQRQGGLRWSWESADGQETRLALWHTRREVEQFLAIPVTVQHAPSHAGGVIALGRVSSGLSFSHRIGGERASWAFGIDLGQLREARRGYENFNGDRLGVRGHLRRDETNQVQSRDLWLSGETHLGQNWSALAAVRHGRLRFSSRDHYLAPGNGDDSGRLDYRKTAYAAGLARRFATGEFFTSLGHGYETPTVTELAYRPDGEGGFNHALSPARFDSIEAGWRWRRVGFTASVAGYRIEGRDEIVQASASGGRTSYTNAGRTRRDGLEAGLQLEPHPNLGLQFTANWLDARFRQSWRTTIVRAGVRETRTVPAGNRVPGIARLTGYAALDWHRRDRLLALALEATGNTALPVDDGNSVAAPGHIRYALALRSRHPDQGGWHAFARIDNLLDRDYIGSVIVNEANGRSFEPAPGRTFTLGIGWRGRE